MENYKLILKEKLEDIKAEGYLFEHKSGAKVIFISNDDENRVFSACFRTLPKDNTGLPHIMEHSVLCGSKKYRIKDPFNELDKGSINTYLNAITFIDKTLYPIASTNEKDFRNLMEVYLDAVFFPLIYERKGIFLQEGWHKEKDGINGVVYNEMLGAFSEPEEKLDFKIKEELYQDTEYKYNSGGVPENIPELSYEKFLDFHKEYYHPANAVLYVYGKNDLEEILSYIDRDYLSYFEHKDIKNEYKKQEKLKENKTIEISYDEDKSVLGVSYIGPLAYEYDKITALGILCDALFNTEAAPVKRRLIDSGLCTDVDGYVDEDLYQSMINIRLQGSKEKNVDRFKEILNEAFREVYEKGLDEKLLKGCILNERFYIAEGDFGYKPKGLFYNLRILQGFIYGEESFENLKFKDIFKRVQEYDYKALLKEMLIDNDKKVYGILKKGSENAEKEIGKDIKCNEEEFFEYQRLEDKQEDIEKIPSITLKEISEEPNEFNYEAKDGVIYTKPKNDDITYVNVVIDTSYVPRELKKYLGIFRYLLGRLDTENYTTEELNNEINYYFGDFETNFSTYYLKNNGFMTSLNFSIKALKENSEKIFEILEEVVFRTKFSDVNKIYNKLKEFKNKIEDSFYSSASSKATLRCLSYFNELNSYNEELRGISFYDFLCKVLDNKEDIIEKMNSVKDYLFRKDNLTFSFSCDKDSREKVLNYYQSFKNNFSSEKNSDIYLIDKNNGIINEGFILNGDVNYNIMGANYAKNGFSFSGKLQVINKIIATDYLWNKVRVENGAYGSDLSIRRNGILFFSSYRDPSVKNTFEIYKNTYKYLDSLKLRDSEIKKYIIGKINVLDKPIKDNSLCEIGLFRYFSGIDHKLLKKERAELLSFNNSDIKNACELFSMLENEYYYCSIGNEKAIKNDKQCFNNIRRIIQKEEL